MFIYEVTRSTWGSSSNDDQPFGLYESKDIADKLAKTLMEVDFPVTVTITRHEVFSEPKVNGEWSGRKKWRYENEPWIRWDKFYGHRE